MSQRQATKTVVPQRRTRAARAPIKKRGRLPACLAEYNVQVPNPSTVRARLKKSPELIPVLEELSERARKEFGDAVEVSLEVYVDPEIDDSYLTMYVRQDRYEAGFYWRVESVSMPVVEKYSHLSDQVLFTTDFRYSSLMPPNQR